jgi:Fe-S-cluster formation regulator IscX/YfhJ
MLIHQMLLHCIMSFIGVKQKILQYVMAHLADDRQHSDADASEIFQQQWLKKTDQKLTCEGNVYPSNAAALLHVLHWGQTKDIMMCYCHLMAHFKADDRQHSGAEASEIFQQQWLKNRAKSWLVKAMLTWLIWLMTDNFLRCRDQYESVNWLV